MLGANVIEVVVTLRPGKFEADGVEQTAPAFDAAGVIFLSETDIDIPERVRNIVAEEMNNRLIDEICNGTTE